MPNEVLSQLHVLRESIADALRKDPRYLTLAALDRSIAEISGVLGAAGMTQTAPTARAPLEFETPPSATSTPAYAGAPAGPAVAPLPPVHASTAEPKRPTPPAEPDGGAHEDADESDDPEPEPAPYSVASVAADPSVSDEVAPPPSSATGDYAGDIPPATLDWHHDPAGVIPPGKAGGYVPMAPRPGAARYQPAISVKFGRLPNKVDLRPLMTPVADQGETNACVADAVAAAFAYWIRKTTKREADLSRLFVYYNARWRDGRAEHDEGSAIQLAMESLKTFGACDATAWPSDPHLVVQRPGADAYRDAANAKVVDAVQVPLTLTAWKQALAEGKPIVFGCLLFGSLNQVSQRGGVVPMQAPDELAHTPYAFHAMCAVGYCDSERVFVVRNSWGADWGDEGYCYMPYAYLLNPAFNDGDCWVFVPKVPSQPPREAWSDDTRPVTGGGAGVHVPIEPYQVDDYAHVATDAFERSRRPFNADMPDDDATDASLAGRRLWSEMDGFDVQTFLASSIAFAGISSLLASEFSGATGTAAPTGGPAADPTDDGFEFADIAEAGADDLDADDFDLLDDAQEDARDFDASTPDEADDDDDADTRDGNDGSLPRL